jgi:hypothetical protein
MTPRWWLAHIVLAALVFAANQAGFVAMAWHADQTYLTAIIAAVWGFGILASAFGHWDTVEWLAQRCFQLGLIGTVLGFIIALSGVDPEQAQNLDATKAMVAILIVGMSTALYTTLLGALANLWLRVLVFALRA